MTTRRPVWITKQGCVQSLFATGCALVFVHLYIVAICGHRGSILAETAMYVDLHNVSIGSVLVTRSEQ
jgi:hypothetical protein